MFSWSLLCFTGFCRISVLSLPEFACNLAAPCAIVAALKGFSFCFFSCRPGIRLHRRGQESVIGVLAVDVVFAGMGLPPPRAFLAYHLWSKAFWQWRWSPPPTSSRSVPPLRCNVFQHAPVVGAMLLRPTSPRSCSF